MKSDILMKLLPIIGIFILLLVIYPRQAIAQCAGTRNSCCSNLDCTDYCSDSYYRKYSGICRVIGTPCVYSSQYCTTGCDFVNGVCKEECEVSFVENYTCSGDWRMIQKLNRDCSLSWEKYDYCNYGCNNGKCNPICPQPLDEYKCVGSDRYQKYQDCDRTYDWNISQHCQYGCFNNACLSSSGIPEMLGGDTAGITIKVAALVAVVALIVFIVIKMKKII